MPREHTAPIDPPPWAVLDHELATPVGEAALLGRGVSLSSDGPHPLAIDQTPGSVPAGPWPGIVAIVLLVILQIALLRRGDGAGRPVQGAQARRPLNAR